MLPQTIAQQQKESKASRDDYFTFTPYHPGSPSSSPESFQTLATPADAVFTPPVSSPESSPALSDSGANTYAQLYRSSLPLLHRLGTSDFVEATRPPSVQQPLPGLIAVVIEAAEDEADQPAVAAYSPFPVSPHRPDASLPVDEKEAVPAKGEVASEGGSGSDGAARAELPSPQASEDVLVFGAGQWGSQGEWRSGWMSR